MATNIEWTEETWNPVVGCSKCSPGCENCYAERRAYRLAMTSKKCYEAKGKPKPFGLYKYEKVVTMFRKWTGEISCDEKALEVPLHWKTSRKIFVVSMGDLFHPGVPFEFIDKVMAVIWESACRRNGHTYQILTKRHAGMMEYYNSRPWSRVAPILKSKYGRNWGGGQLAYPENLWLGVTVCNQKEADEKIPTLLQIPAAKRFLSIEPMLGAVDLNLATRCDRNCSEYQNAECPGTSGLCIMQPKLDWIIVGGESGPGARPMKPDWARGIRDQCQAADVPFFFKQWGEWLQVVYKSDEYYKLKCHNKEAGAFHPNSGFVKNCFCAICEAPGFYRVTKKAAGCLLDGVEHKEMPG